MPNRNAPDTTAKRRARQSAQQPEPDEQPMPDGWAHQAAATWRGWKTPTTKHATRQAHPNRQKKDNPERKRKEDQTNPFFFSRQKNQPQTKGLARAKAKRKPRKLFFFNRKKRLSLNRKQPRAKAKRKRKLPNKRLPPGERQTRATIGSESNAKETACAKRYTEMFLKGGLGGNLFTKSFPPKFIAVSSKLRARCFT